MEADPVRISVCRTQCFVHTVDPSNPFCLRNCRDNIVTVAVEMGNDLSPQGRNQVRQGRDPVHGKKLIDRKPAVTIADIKGLGAEHMVHVID